eukprot:scaffold738_cov340-Pavlova_lutheri.AAC.44
MGLPSATSLAPGAHASGVRRARAPPRRPGLERPPPAPPPPHPRLTWQTRGPPPARPRGTPVRGPRSGPHDPASGCETPPSRLPAPHRSPVHMSPDLGESRGSGEAGEAK